MPLNLWIMSLMISMFFGKLVMVKIKIKKTVFFFILNSVGGSEGPDSTAHMGNHVRVVTACQIGL